MLRNTYCNTFTVEHNTTRQQNKIKQNKTKQNKTKQNKTKQNKTNLNVTVSAPPQFDQGILIIGGSCLHTTPPQQTRIKVQQLFGANVGTVWLFQ